MASEAFAGVGTRFQRWNGSQYVDIAEINSIEGPTMTKDVIEVTSLDTDAGYNEFITGFAEGGTVMLDMNFTRDTYELMKDDFELDLLRYYNIILPDGTALSFAGFVMELPIVIEADDKITADVTIQISSMVELELGSGAPSEEEASVYTTRYVQNATPSRLDINYSQTLDSGSTPATTAFAVLVAGSSRTVNSVAISGSQVRLTLASAVTYGQTVTVAYTAPGTNPIQNAAGIDAASFGAISVTNNVAVVVESSDYDVDLQTYWAGLTTPLDTAQKERLETLITSIKTGLGITNLSDKFDVMYVLANQTLEAAMRNVVKRAHDCVDPSSADYGLPDFEQYRGVYSTWNYGEHLDTDYNQLRDADNALVTDCAIGVYCTDEKATPGATMAWGSGPYNSLILRYTTTENARGNINGVAVSNFMQNDSSVGYGQGFTIIGRTGNNMYHQKDGGTWVGPVASTAGSGYGATMLILASRDASGNVTGMTNNEIGFFFISSNLNQAQADVIVEAVEAYMDAIGAGEISSAF